MVTEKTFVIFKPDALGRGIVGDILSRFEKVGLKVAALKMINATKEQLEKHYYKDEVWLKEKGIGIIKNKGYDIDYDPIKAGKEIVESLVDDMRILPVIVMVLEGHNAVAVTKKLVGPTNINEANPGTIRGDYSHDTYDLANVSNRPIITIVHCSGSQNEAKEEIKIWFTKDEILEYTKADESLHYRKRN